MRKQLLFTTLALTLIAAPAMAQGGKMFEKHDTDGDGAISKAEFMAVAEARFATMDGDGNGAISQDEAAAARAKMKEKMKKYREMRQKKQGAPAE